MHNKKYKETYRELSHGTDVESATIIRNNGFKISERSDSWCGPGIYFYDIKKKAWWAARRKCSEIKKETGKNENKETGTWKQVNMNTGKNENKETGELENRKTWKKRNRLTWKQGKI